MDTLWAHYIADGFEQGRVKGELNGWKKKAQRMSNEYSVLHRSWHERGLYARAWRQIAIDLYEERYKTYDKEDMGRRLEATLKKMKNKYSYNPNERPAMS